ncbi:MAG: toxin-activating lysine-acyltransferase [Alphaproteobacteria bacterium]|nr:toxin-activating lysine-acyltransferase [Alphaproteobacteria bacterium]
MVRMGHTGESSRFTGARYMAETETGTAPDPATVAPPQGEADAAATGADPNVPKFDKVAVLGNALWLMTQSSAHKHLLLQDMDWMLVPPIALQQFRLWRRENAPVAFASWAFMNEEAEERIKTDITSITEDDWNSGEQAWLIDLIAPFGGVEEAVKELKEKILAGRTIKTLQPAPDGKGVMVVEW